VGNYNDHNHVIDEIKITEIVIVVIKMVMMLIDVSISKFSLHR